MYGFAGIGLTATDQLFFEGLFDPDVDAFDRFGEVLAAGDFDDSGHDDLAIGAPLDNSLGLVNAGEVSILYGSDSGLLATGAQLFNMFLFDTLQAGDRFGAALAAGQLDSAHGGFDLGVGAPDREVDGDAQAGAAVVIFSVNLFADGFESGDTSAWQAP